MMTYQRGETAILKLTSKNPDTLALTDPATSVLITVTNPAGTAVVTAQAMVKDSTGTYHYNYTIASDAVLGWYRQRVTTNDAGIITNADGWFQVEA